MEDLVKAIGALSKSGNLSDKGSKDAKALADSLSVLASIRDSLRLGMCTRIIKRATFVDTSMEAACLTDGGISTLDVAGLTGYSDGGAALVELLATGFGVVRATISAAISNVEDDEPNADVKEDVQRLITNGGNLVFNVGWPGYAARSKWGSLTLAANGRAGFDVPAFGARVSNPTSNGAANVELRTRLRDNNDALDLFGQVRVEAIWGSTDFRGALGLLPDDKSKLWYGQVMLGATIRQTLVVTWTRVFQGAAPLKTFGTQISITASRPLDSLSK
jgi:hypothetical protein